MTLVLSQQRAGREVAARFSEANFQRFVDALPSYARAPMTSNLFAGYCRDGDVARLEAFLQPKLGALGGGNLELARTKERIASCVAIRNAKGPEIGAVLDRFAP